MVCILFFFLPGPWSHAHNLPKEVNSSSMEPSLHLPKAGNDRPPPHPAQSRGSGGRRPEPANPGAGQPHCLASSRKSRLPLQHHTGESLTKAVYWAEGSLIPETLEEINFLLRDFRTGEVKEIQPGLYDLLFSLRRKLGVSEPFHVISGYRSPPPTPCFGPPATGWPATACICGAGDRHPPARHGTGEPPSGRAGSQARRGRLLSQIGFRPCRYRPGAALVTPPRVVKSPDQRAKAAPDGAALAHSPRFPRPVSQLTPAAADGPR